MEQGEEGVKMLSHRMIRIEEQINEYTDSFTIHGLTRSVRGLGRSKQSLFWALTLFVGVVLASVIVSGRVQKYRSFQVYTELKSETNKENHLPSIIICEKNLLQLNYFAYTGKSNMDEHMNTSVSPFNITFCKSMGSIDCIGDDFFKSNLKLNQSCIIWNYKGDFHDAYGEVTIQFQFDKPNGTNKTPDIFAIPQDPRITEIDISKRLSIEPQHEYTMIIDKTITKRLPAPFPTNCSKEGSAQNIFDGAYTRFLCIESYYYVDMYKTCSDIFDYHRQYIPATIKEKYSENPVNTTRVRACLLEYSRGERFDLNFCRLACEVIDYDYYWTFKTRHSTKNHTNKSRYKLTIQLKKPNEYTVLEEKQLYTMSQMLCEIGGFVGLIMGMSVISVIEVIAVCVLQVIKKVVLFNTVRKDEVYS